MKFLCPSCKSKYQILDQKIEGKKRPRMKCRKCGEVIDIRAAAGLRASMPPPSKAAPSPPTAEPPSERSAPSAEASSPRPPAAAKPAPKPAAPKRPAVTRPVPGGRPPPRRKVGPPAAKAPPRRGPPAAPPPRRAAPPPRAAAAAADLEPEESPEIAAADIPPSSGVSPEPQPDSAEAPSAPEATDSSPEATPRPPSAPRASSPGSSPLGSSPGSSPRDSAPLGSSPLGSSPLGSSPQGSPSSGSSLDAPSSTSTPTPVGSSPASSEDEAPSGGLASAFAAAVRDEPAPAVSASGPGDEWYVGINGVPLGPIKLQTLRQKAAQGAVTPESLVWRDGFEEWLPLSTYPELVAIVEEGLSSARASLSPQAAGGVPSVLPQETATSFTQPSVAAPAAPAGDVVISDKDDSDEMMAALTRKRSSGYAAWIAVVVALLFGLTIGFVVFSSQKPAEPIVKYVEVPAKTNETEKGNTSDGEEPTEEPSNDGDEGKKVVTGKRPVTGAVGKVPTSTNGTPQPVGQTKKGLAGLSGLRPSGPSSGPGSKGTSGGGGKPLDSAIVQRTVSRYKSSVKRGCWQPAINTRDKNAPSSARVGVSITVGPSGGVQSARTTGDPKGYRGLARCIASRVRTWRFPSSGEKTTVNVPFVFASQ